MNKQMHKWRISVCLLAVLLLALSLTGCTGNVKLKNADFESGADARIDGWTQYNYQSSAAGSDVTDISLVDSDAGGKCVRIRSTGTNDARIYQKIKVVKNGIYKVTARVKIDGTVPSVENAAGTASAGAGFNISALNAVQRSEGVYTTGDGWQEVVAYIQAGPKQTSVELSLGLGGYSAESSGTVYIDDVSVEKVRSAPSGATVVSVTPYSASDNGKNANTEVKTVFKMLFAVLVVALVVYVVLLLRKHDAETYANQLPLSEAPARMHKRDYIVVGIMTLVCAVASFYKLGDTKAASSYWDPEVNEESVTVEFDQPVTVSRVTYYPNIRHSDLATYLVEFENEAGQYETAFTIRYVSGKDNPEFFEWFIHDASFTTQRVRVTAVIKGWGFNEMAFWQEVNGRYERVPLHVTQTDSGNAEKGGSCQTGNTPDKLFDEQTLAQAYRTFENGTYFDEIYFPRTAYEHINGFSIYEWTHPPLGKTLISVGISLFGMNPFGWRFMGTLLGVCLVPLLYLLALRLFKNSSYAFVAAFLMMCDFMRTAQTRLSTIDTYSVFFIILMYYFMYDYFSIRSYDRPFWRSLAPLAFSGVCFGLGAASKWTSIYAGVGLAVLFFMAKLSEAMDVRFDRCPHKEGQRANWLLGNFLPTCLACVIFFILIPGTIYLLSYIPYMPSNPGKSLWQIMMDNQEAMYTYHSKTVLGANPHAYQSPWYSWLLDMRPIYYYSSASAGLPDGIRASVVSMGNPAVWWVGLACIPAALYYAWKKRSKAMVLAFVGYACQLFPWILVARMTFIYHYFTSIPFLILIIVFTLKSMREDGVIGKPTVIVYMAVVLALYLLFYPVLVGIPVSNDYISGLRWFSTWDF